MSIFRIILVHLNHRRLKTFLLSFALTLGVATVVAMVTLVAAMRLELGSELDKFGPNIVIMPRFEGQELYYGSDRLEEVDYDLKPLTEGDIARIRTIKDSESLNIISPKLVGGVRFNGQPALLVGLDIESEFTMKPWITLASAQGLPRGDLTKLRELELPRDGLLLGSKAAARFSAVPGDRATINGQTFTVTGILSESGGDEDGLIFADLETTQTLLDFEHAFSMIEINGFCNFCPIEDMASQITDILPNAKVTALREAALVREETIDRFEAFGILLSGAALLVSILFAISTLLAAVNERIAEIGVYRAIGFRRSLIIRLIVIETVLVSLVSGLAGFAAGILAARLIGPSLGQITGPAAWDLRLLLPAVALSVFLGILASLYPALKAAHLDPADSIRHI